MKTKSKASEINFIYGTAWKEDQTEDLVFKALQSGFVAIDTANQRKHYFEEGSGRGLQKFLKLGTKSRDELFLQTKFTFARSQDHRKPYDQTASYATQVEQSFLSSLSHLGVDHIDSYILHGPNAYGESHLSAEDFEVWKAMEALCISDKVRYIGVSNIQLNQLKELVQNSEIQPTFVQNRCYANKAWDKEIRIFCRDKGLIYQGFSVLTANKTELQNPKIRSLAAKYKKTESQIIFRFCRQIQILPLTGTTSALHMQEDLDILDFELTGDEIALIENVGSR